MLMSLPAFVAVVGAKLANEAGATCSGCTSVAVSTAPPDLDSASAAAHSALFDHTKTRYIARAGGGYSERDEDLGVVAAERDRAWRERRYRDALLLWTYHHYSTAQHAALAIPPAADPAAWRAANAGRMRAWTALGIGTHFALAYLCTIAAYWWPEAIAAYFVLCTTGYNLYFLVLMRLESRAVAG